MTELLFQFPQDYDTDLVFGAYPDELISEATVAITLPAMTFSATVVPTVEAELAATFPAMSAAFTAEYNSRAERPTVGATATDWQRGDGAEAGVDHGMQVGAPLETGSESHYQPAAKLAARVEAVQPDNLDPLRHAISASHTEAVRASTDRHSSFADGLRDRRVWRSARHQNAAPVQQSRSARHQDALRDRRGWRSSRFSGTVGVGRVFAWDQTKADKLGVGWDVIWQAAMKPPAGMYAEPPVEPPGELCYTPNPHLVFAKLADGTGDLLFICDNYVEPPPGPGETVIVPVRSVYMVLNEVSLRRVSGPYIPTLAMSLRIDAQSWTWSFDATVPAAAQADLEPVGGDPVELEATINGHTYRVVAESLSRERGFATSTLKVSGRGKSAYLDAPYAPSMNFTNTIDRTAQQLMNDALTLGGVSIGWTVDWQITDWLVQAGVWSHQGSYISALKAIAESAGAYLQPHPTNQTMRVKALYPSAPWNWGSVTPDYELPAALTTREGIEWRESARYNAVYVSGQASGILGHVKRTGTDGGLVAPMVVDPLITHVDAARQRGISVLSDTGRQALVSLRVPVLAETGVIEPGKFVRYVDGGVERLGIVRSTAIDVSYPDVFQSLGVETHV